MTDPVQPVPSAVPAPPIAPGPATAPIATTSSADLASVIAKPKSSGGRGTSILLVLAGAIAVGGVAFAAGRLTAPAAATTAGRFVNGQFQGGTGQLPGNGDRQGFAGRVGGFGGISLAGTVAAVSADSITLKLESGTSVTIPLDGKTTYHAAAAASAGDVTVGSQVRVTPGARSLDPGASFDPNASPVPGASPGGLTFGAASDVTVVQP